MYTSTHYDTALGRLPGMGISQAWGKAAHYNLMTCNISVTLVT